MESGMRKMGKCSGVELLGGSRDAGEQIDTDDVGFRDEPGVPEPGTESYWHWFSALGLEEPE